MKVWGYIRVSTNEQADSRLGLEAQMAAIVGACEQRGYELLGIHEDAGFSGSTLNRPALDELLANVQRGESVMFSKLCRVSRSIHDFPGLMKRAGREGWHPICLDPDLDLATPNGELVANVLVSVLTWERRIIGQRTKEALDAKRARGEYVGGKPHIVGELARDIQAMRATGMTYRAICTDLEARGVPTPRGGSSWRPSSLQGVLTSGRTSSPMSQGV